MVHYHDYGLTAEEYANTDIKGIAPVYEVCLNPNCRAVDRLYRHGYRERYAIIGSLVLLILICRLRCKHCKKVFTILPSFLMKNFQHAVQNIFNFLSGFFKHRYSGIYRQLLYFYRKRFLSNIKLLEMYMRDTGTGGVFPAGLNEKAMKVIELITEDGINNFYQKFSTRFHNHFMTPLFAN